MISVAGAAAASKTAGLGLAANVHVIDKRVEAYIDSSGSSPTTVHANQHVLVQADSNESFINIAAGFAVSASEGAKFSGAGSAVVLTLDTVTRAKIGASATVSAGGNVGVAAHSDTDLLHIAGGIAFTTGVLGIGISNSTVTKNDTTEAYIDANADVNARGTAGSSVLVDGSDITGLAVLATSNEEFQAIVAAAGISTKTVGIAGQAGVNVLNETTRAYIADGAHINDDNATSSPNAAQSVTVKAVDTTDIISVAGGLAYGGKVGVGVGADVGVLTKTTEAYIGNNSVVNAKSDVFVIAENKEDIVSVAANAGIGGTVGVAGTAGVWTIDNATRAYVAGSSTTANAARVIADGSVVIAADDDTTADIVAGNVAGAGTVAVGAAADVSVINKVTDAYIGQNAVVTGKASTGNSVTVNTGQFDTQFTTDQNYYFDPTAAGIIANDEISLPGPHGFTTGQAISYSTNGGDGEDNGLDAIGGLEEGQTYYAYVTAANKLKLATTEADALSGSDLIALTASAARGTQHSLAPEGEIIARPEQDDFTDFDGDGSADTTDDPTSDTTYQGQVIASASEYANFRGVSVTATNKDDLETIAITGGGAGTVAVNVGGTVHLITNTTTAHIDANAKVNQDNTGAGSGQTVQVAAGNDYRHMGVAGAASFAGTVAVAPAVDVSIINFTTKAYIDDGALVNAANDIEIKAEANEDILSIAAGVAGAGEVAVAGSAAVAKINNITEAYIGDDATTDAGGAVAVANGNVLISASDNTDIDMVAGGLAIGVGAVGVGAGIGVNLITKDTSAFIGSHAQVNAHANSNSLADTIYDGGGSTTVSTLSGFKGIAVQAASSEDLFAVAAAAGIGFAAGVAGGIQVAVIDSDTAAFVGPGADLNDDNLDGTITTNGEQRVKITAVNQTTSLTVGGGAGGGIAGVGGGVDVGIIRNDTSAYVDDGADIRARSNVDVDALATKDVTTLAISAAAGGVAAVGSVSVWSIGTALDGNYSTEEQGQSSANSLDSSSGDYASPQSFAGSMAGGGDADHGYQTMGTGYQAGATFTASSGVNLGTDTLSVATGHGLATGDAVVYYTDGNNAVGGLVNGRTYYAIVSETDDTVMQLAETGRDAANGVAIDLTILGSGTQRLVPLLTTLTADANSAIVGGAAEGDVDDAVNLTATDPRASSGTTARIDPSTTVAAGDDVNVRARSEIDFHAVAGSAAAGGLSFGASIVVANIKENVSAFIDDNATVSAGTDAGDDILVWADSDNDLEGVAFAGQAGTVVALGAQVVVIRDTSTQTAFIDDGAQIPSAGGTVTVKAEADRVSDVSTLGVAGSGGVSAGASVAIGEIKGATSAFVGDVNWPRTSTNIGNLVVTADSAASVEADATGVAIGGYLGANGTVAIGRIEPIVSATVDATSTVGVDGDITVQSLSTGNADANTLGASVGALAIGASVSITSVSPTITTQVGAGTNLDAGDTITVQSLHNYDTQLNRLTDKLALSDATSGAGGLAAGIGADADSYASPTVTTSIAGGSGTTINAGGGITVQSHVSNSASSSGLGVAVGVVGVGASLADATVSGANTASIGGGTITAPSLTVLANTYEAASSDTISGTGGIIAASGSVANSTVAHSTEAYLGDSATLNVSGAVSVTAIATPEATSDAQGVNAGGLAVGASHATSTVGPLATGPRVSARVGNSATITADSLAVSAQQVIPSGGDSAYAYATGASGALIGIDATLTDAHISGAVQAYIGDTATLTIDGETTIAANNATSQHAESNSVAGGIIAVGVSASDVSSDVDTQAWLGSAAQMTGASLSVTALSTDENQSVNFAAGGGAIAGAGADTDTINTSTTTAEIKAGTAGRKITLLDGGDGALSIVADHMARFNGEIQTVSGGVLAGTGAEINHDVTSTVESKVGQGVVVDADNITMDAFNRVDKPWLSEENIEGTTGGLASAAGASSYTTLSLTTLVTVDDNADLEVPGDISDPGEFSLEALNSIVAMDKSTLTTGGALSGAGVTDSITTTADVARIQIGDGAKLTSVGAMEMSSRGQGEVRVLVEAETYGVATVAVGDSIIDIQPTNEILIGDADIVALGDLKLAAGSGFDLDRDDWTIEARVDVFAGTRDSDHGRRCPGHADSREPHRNRRRGRARNGARHPADHRASRLRRHDRAG